MFDCCKDSSSAYKSNVREAKKDISERTRRSTPALPNASLRVAISELSLLAPVCFAWLDVNVPAAAETGGA